MPATITHAYFAEDLYKKLPINIQNKIKNQKKKFMMFSQSMDALMFYNITTPLPGKRIRNLAEEFHNNKTDEFFKTLIETIKINKSYQDEQTLVFLYGLIAHYCLDSTTHPYIIYKTGYFDINDKKTYKYNGYHNYMESYIDLYFLNQRFHGNKFKFKTFCFDTTKFSKDLSNTIDICFDNCYNIKNMSKIYYKSLKQMTKFLDYFRLDQKGIKKKIYQVFDKITPSSFFCLPSISYYLDDYEKLDLLNKNHKKWNYPVDKNIFSHDGFLELYKKSLETCLYLIEKVNNYFFQNQEINIKNLFENKSYVTGIDCNSKKYQKYFEF